MPKKKLSVIERQHIIDRLIAEDLDLIRDNEGILKEVLKHGHKGYYNHTDDALWLAYRNI